MNRDDSPYLVLVGVDYSDVSRAALSEALKLMRAHGRSHLHVLYAPPSTPQLGPAIVTPDLAAVAMTDVPMQNSTAQNTVDAARELRTFVETALTSAGSDGGASSATAIPWSTHVREADPPDAIVELATELRANLIVVGTHGRRGFERLLLGSVAEAVVRRAPCPVLVVPPPRAEEGPPNATSARDAEG